MNDLVSSLLRSEIDLPDDAGHQKVVNLFHKVQEAIDLATKKGYSNDIETLERLKKRLTARIIPERVTLLDTQLAIQMLNTGIEIDKVNRARNALYVKAQDLMFQAIDQGMNQSGIARILGVDRATVRSSTTKVVATKNKDGKRLLKRVPMTYEEFLRTREAAEEYFASEQEENG